MPLPASPEETSKEPTNPCAICGRHSTSKAWGFWLCWGEAERVGCVSQLCAVLPFENEKDFTERWVREQKARAA